MLFYIEGSKRNSKIIPISKTTTQTTTATPVPEGDDASSTKRTTIKIAKKKRKNSANELHRLAAASTGVTPITSSNRSHSESYLNRDNLLISLNAAGASSNANEPRNYFIQQHEDDEDDEDDDDDDTDLDDDEYNSHDDDNDAEADESNELFPHNFTTYATSENLNNDVNQQLETSDYYPPIDIAVQLPQDDAKSTLTQHVNVPRANDENDHGQKSLTGDEEIFKLYKIILEQTDPVIWDNNLDLDQDNISTSSSAESSSDHHHHPSSDEIKVTITSQIPFNRFLGNSNSSRVSPNANGKQLTVTKSDHWSNLNVDKPASIEVELISDDMSQPNNRKIISKVNSIDEDDMDERPKQTSAPAQPKALMSSSSSLDRFRTLERQTPSPVDELENQMKFYERVKNTFYLELEKTNLNLDGSNNNNNSNSAGSSSTINQNNKLNLSPNSSQLVSPIKRRSTSFEQKFFNNSATHSPPMSLLSPSNNSDQHDSSDVSNHQQVSFIPFKNDLIELHNYTGECVGGEPVVKSTSSSRSSSISLPTSSKKSLDDDFVDHASKSKKSNSFSIDDSTSTAVVPTVGSVALKAPNESIDLSLVPTIVVQEHKQQPAAMINTDNEELTRVTSMFDSYPSEMSTGTDSSSLNFIVTNLATDLINSKNAITTVDPTHNNNIHQQSIMLNSNHDDATNHNGSSSNNLIIIDTHNSRELINDDEQNIYHEIKQGDDENTTLNYECTTMTTTQPESSGVDESEHANIHVDLNEPEKSIIDSHFYERQQSKQEVDIEKPSTLILNDDSTTTTATKSLIKLSSSKNFIQQDEEDTEHEHRKETPTRRSLLLKKFSETFKLPENKHKSNSSQSSCESNGEHSKTTLTTMPKTHQHRERNKRKSRINSLLTSLSPLKKKSNKTQSETSSNNDPTTTSWLISSKIQPPVTGDDIAPINNYNPMINTDYYADYVEEDQDEDEFFLAISSSGLQTGSCPEFYWYPYTHQCASNTTSTHEFTTNLGLTSSGLTSYRKHRSKSENDLYVPNTIKSYENITHTNYVQMVNSMINGAISEVADPEYVEYVKRHIQGLFENFAPVLMKSKSNEEMAINSPSRDKIVDMINQSIPKSVSLDFKLLEESKLNRDEDVMDFSKFGLGIDDRMYDRNRYNDQGNDDDEDEDEDESTTANNFHTESELTERNRDDTGQLLNSSSCKDINGDDEQEDEDLNRSFLVNYTTGDEEKSDDEVNDDVTVDLTDEDVKLTLEGLIDQVCDLIDVQGEVEDPQPATEQPNLIDFETGELKSSTRINFDDDDSAATDFESATNALNDNEQSNRDMNDDPIKVVSSSLIDNEPSDLSNFQIFYFIVQAKHLNYLIFIKIKCIFNLLT